jgi:hypothetical protein
MTHTPIATSDQSIRNGILWFALRGYSGSPGGSPT